MVVKKIPPIYKGVHAIVAAPGPSLTPDVVNTLREVKNKYAIFGVGDVYKVIDFLDEHYACDARWWNVHGEKLNSMYPNLSMWCHDSDGEKYGAKRVHGVGSAGFSTNPSLIHYGSNSGYQMLNLAYLWGCTKMILVGYNMKKVGSKSHFFTGKREGNLQVNSPYSSFAAKYNTIQKDIRDMIINCTPDSALTAFRVEDLDEELRKRK